MAGMDREKIIFLRNFFFAAFIIGLVFAFFYFGATLLFWNTAASWATYFFGIDGERIRRTGFALFYPAARGAGILVPRASVGPSLDGARKVVWGACASRVLVSASRRNRLFSVPSSWPDSELIKSSRSRDAFASTRDGRAPQISRCQS